MGSGRFGSKPRHQRPRSYQLRRNIAVLKSNQPAMRWTTNSIMLCRLPHSIMRPFRHNRPSFLLGGRIIELKFFQWYYTAGVSFGLLRFCGPVLLWIFCSACQCNIPVFPVIGRSLCWLVLIRSFLLLSPSLTLFNRSFHVHILSVIVGWSTFTFTFILHFLFFFFCSYVGHLVIFSFVHSTFRFLIHFPTKYSSSSSSLLLLPLNHIFSKYHYYYYYYYYYSIIRAFHISVNRWFFTGVWETASLLKSP